MNKYLKEYTWPDIREMLENSKADPKECTDDCTGKLVVITGATSGIGYLTAREYASHGANLFFIGRNKEKLESLCAEIRHSFSTECEYRVADFTRFSDVYKVADQILELGLEIDILIHNAGVFSTKKLFTENNIEMVFQVNYLASFILNTKLQHKLKSQGKTRIIFVNSEGHRFAVTGLKMHDLRWKKRIYLGLRSYGAAKTAQLLSMIKLNDFYLNSGVTVNAMHPGNVKTNMGENNGGLYRFFKHLLIDGSAKSADISAKALYYLGVSKDVAGVSGKYFNLTTAEESAPPTLDRAAAEELWDASVRLVSVK